MQNPENHQPRESKTIIKKVEVIWGTLTGVALLWFGVSFLHLSGWSDYQVTFSYFLSCLILFYLLIYLMCQSSIHESFSYFVGYNICLAAMLPFFNNDIVGFLCIALVTAPAMLLIRKTFSSRALGMVVIGNFLLVSIISFVLWKMFMINDTVEELGRARGVCAPEFHCQNYVEVIGDKIAILIDFLLPHTPLKLAVFLLCLSVYGYVFLLCTALKSRWRWILYIIAGIAVFITGASYYHDFDPVVQIAVFLFLFIVFCIGGALIQNEPKKKNLKPKEQLGLTTAYDKLHLLIRKFLNGEEKKALLLLGRWGMGKTHCIRYLASELSRERHIETKQDLYNTFMGKVEICQVNLWEYSSREEAWNAIIQALGRTILGRHSFLNSITLNKYLPRIMRSLPGGNIFSSLYELVFLSDRDRDEVLCEQLSDTIANDERIVLIFDDVERADFQIIKALPPLVEKLSRIERLMVICSLAKDELAKVHQREINQEKDNEFALENLTGYLNKVFDYLFQIPEITKACCEEFINIKLEEKIHGSECDLTKDFMENCGLLFTTPRQIERSIELLMGIEFQYKAIIVDDEEKGNSPKEERRNLLYKKKSHIIFLVEIMKMFYPQVLHVAQLDPRGPVEFAKKVAGIFESLNSLDDANCSKVWQVEIFRKEYKYIYDLIKTDYFVYLLLKALTDCDSDYVEKAIRGEYKRHLPLTSEETQTPYKKGSDNSSELVRRSPSDKSTIFQFIDPQKLERFENVMNHLSENRYLVLFNQLVDQGRFEHDRRIFRNDNMTFVWSMEHFFHLLYIYTRKFVGKKEIINAVLKMFDRASAIEKVNILREFCTDNLPFEFKDTMLFVFHDYIEKVSCSVIIDLIKEMYIRYIKNIIHDIADFRMHNEEIVLDYYRAYHFYDLLKREDFIKDCTMEVPGDTTDEGIVNLMDFAALRSGFGEGYDGEQMATSEFKANIILSALRVWFDSHSVSSVISTKIDGLIKKCNDSIAYWKDDKTGLNTLRNYTVGAEKVKKFLEVLKGRQSSARH